MKIRVFTLLGVGALSLAILGACSSNSSSSGNSPSSSQTSKGSSTSSSQSGAYKVPAYTLEQMKGFITSKDSQAKFVNVSGQEGTDLRTSISTGSAANNTIGESTNTYAIISTPSAGYSTEIVWLSNSENQGMQLVQFQKDTIVPRSGDTPIEFQAGSWAIMAGNDSGLATTVQPITQSALTEISNAGDLQNLAG